MSFNEPRALHPWELPMLALPKALPTRWNPRGALVGAGKESFSRGGAESALSAALSEGMSGCESDKLWHLSVAGGPEDAAAPGNAGPGWLQGPAPTQLLLLHPWCCPEREGFPWAQPEEDTARPGWGGNFRQLCVEEQCHCRGNHNALAATSSTRFCGKQSWKELLEAAG